jgi:hypothetical protein
MSLSINPIAQLVNQVASAISKATNEGQAALPQVGDAVTKANLDSKMSRLSGGLNSGLNGLVGGTVVANTGSTLTAAFGQTSKALGGIQNVASSLPGVNANIGSLQSVTGSISNITADISGSINKLTGGNLAGGLMGLAGNISKGAGMLNNILSLGRGANLPAGGELFLKQGTPIQLFPGTKGDWRVRITCQWNIFNSPLFTLLEKTGGVVWPYNPSITVSTKAEYNSISTIHSNYQMYGYKNSTVDDIQISGEFTCETEEDAAYWIAATTFFKTATKMFFGEGALAGNPPLICNLTGYGSSVFDKVPVIIKSFSVDLKEDVNYINCNTFNTNTWVPVVSTISVTVAPVYNRRKQRKFSLEQYSQGTPSSGVGYI